MWSSACFPDPTQVAAHAQAKDGRGDQAAVVQPHLEARLEHDRPATSLNSKTDTTRSRY
jgi:hypothetical protein